MKKRFRIREVVFVSDKEYPQGIGMTWDDLDVLVDVEDGEKIIQVEKGWGSGSGPDAEVPWIRVWIKTPVVVEA